MTNKVEGYLTSDKEFFINEKDAIAHEQEVQRKKNTEKFVEFMYSKCGYVLAPQSPLARWIAENPKETISIIERHFVNG